MSAYTIKVRRYQPEASEDDKRGAYWESFDVELDPTLSVLDGLLQARNDQDGTLSVRCSCRAAICGSCGVKINGQSTLACKTQIGEAAAEAARLSGSSGERGRDAQDIPSSSTHRSGGTGREAEDPAGVIGREAGDPAGVIVVEPMGIIPVIQDLVNEMESTHCE
jgi:succinate dehydrogenase/fumarate reductase-like Fe-S protein